MRAVRLPWVVAGGLAALCHLPLLLIELELAAASAPDELTIDLSTFLPEPEPPPEEPAPPTPPPEPLPERPTPPKPPEPVDEPPPEEPPAEEPAPLPTPVPVPSDDPPAVDEPTPSSESTPAPDAPAEPTPVKAPPPPPPPPPPKPPFDPRAYRDLAFALVERHKRYPRKARVLGQQGKVLLLLHLDEEGRLMREPKVQRSSGVDVLDEEAVRMVKAAAPFPKPEGEISRVPILVPLTIHFRLEDP